VTIVLKKKQRFYDKNGHLIDFFFSFVNSGSLQKGVNRQNTHEMDQKRLSWLTFLLVLYKKTNLVQRNEIKILEKFSTYGK